MSTNTEKAGGTRYSTGKPGGWWYAPLYGLRLVAEVWQMGAGKYAPKDWQNGQSFSTLFDCMSRHWLAVTMNGIWSRDPESGAYHLAHLTWNALTLLTFMALERHDLDDCTVWDGVTAKTRAVATREAILQLVPVEQVLREWHAAEDKDGTPLGKALFEEEIMNAADVLRDSKYPGFPNAHAEGEDLSIPDTHIGTHPMADLDQAPNE